MQIGVGKLMAQVAGLFVAFALLLFVPAGTLRWVAGWVFLALFFGGMTALGLWLRKANPDLLNERETELGKADQAGWDKVIMTLMSFLFLVWLVVIPLDAVRYHWSHIPVWAQVAGGALFCVASYIIFLAYRENTYLSPAVRIQRERGHQVISTGPYHYVRHPLYAGFFLLFIGGSLLLGSWGGLLVLLLDMIPGAIRTLKEEALLRAELPGYSEYTTRVKYRIIPYLW